MIKLVWYVVFFVDNWVEEICMYFGMVEFLIVEIFVKLLDCCFERIMIGLLRSVLL